METLQFKPMVDTVPIKPGRLDEVKRLGVHIIFELYGCDPDTLKDKNYVEEVMLRAARESNAHAIGSFFHQFKPHGVSGVIIIEESHLSIHTWPEHGYAAIDFFYCSDNVKPLKAMKVFSESFKPRAIEKQVIDRGLV